MSTLLPVLIENWDLLLSRDHSFKALQNERIVNRLNSMADEYRVPTTDTLTKKINYYSDIMHNKHTLCKKVTLLPYRKV